MLLLALFAGVPAAQADQIGAATRTQYLDNGSVWREQSLFAQRSLRTDDVLGVSLLDVQRYGLSADLLTLSETHRLAGGGTVKGLVLRSTGVAYLPVTGAGAVLDVSPWPRVEVRGALAAKWYSTVSSVPAELDVSRYAGRTIVTLGGALDLSPRFSRAGSVFAQLHADFGKVGLTARLGTGREVDFSAPGIWAVFPQSFGFISAAYRLTPATTLQLSVSRVTGLDARTGVELELRHDT